MTTTKLPPYIGRFKTVDFLGAGSFANAFLVEGGPSGLVLKWLRADAPKDGKPRMQNEIWALQQLDHPAIPKFLDSGTEAERPFFVMTRARGISLRARHQNQIAWSSVSGERWVLKVMTTLLDAIKHMQDRGIYHRDIKDDNIVTDDQLDNVAVIDFGFCRGMGQPADGSSFRNVGATRYSPPSKLKHPSQVHPTHDVFAVGVTAYLMLTNEYPWSAPDGEDFGHLAERMINVRPPSVDQVNSFVSREVASFIDDLLVVDDNDRPTAPEAHARAEDIRSRLSSPTDAPPRISGRTSRHFVLPRVIRDPIHGDVRMTEFEWEILGTPEFQRLRRIKQLGSTHLVFPGAEHTRFNHSIGTMFVADKILRSIEEVSGAPISPEERLTVRSYALIHDITHICFGHTIEDELGFYTRHDSNAARYERLLFSEKSALHTVLSKTDFGRAALACVSDQIGRQSASDAATDRPRTIMAELVGSSFGADVLDYIDRDSYFCGLDHRVDSAIFRRYRLSPFEGMPQRERHLVSRVLGTYGLRLDAEFALESVLLERFALFLKVYTHPAKISAGAMLGKALSLNGKRKTLHPIQEEKIEQMSDEQLLLLLASSGPKISQTIAAKLLARKLYKPVFRARPLILGSADRKTYAAQREKFREKGLCDPNGRASHEETLAKKSGIEGSDVIIYCTDGAPGYQKVQQFIEDGPGGPALRDEAHDHHREMLDRHLGLWSVYIFVEPSVDERSKQKLQGEAERLFGLTNEIAVDRKQGMLF